MSKYVKETPRITVKAINSDTEEVLFELKDRNWMNLGEIFPDSTMTSLITNELKNRKLPKNIMVLAIAEYSLEE